MIKDIGQVICADKELHTGEMVALFDLMQRTGETAIKLIAGDKHEQIIEMLSQSD